jgi:hypothetical protein
MSTFGKQVGWLAVKVGGPTVGGPTLGVGVGVDVAVANVSDAVHHS